MATSDILGLFMSPEQYQAQQMAQQQAADQQRAFNFAQLSPRDQAVYGMFLGGQQLGRGFGGLLGVQDPQLQRIRQRQEIMQSINPADMESLTAGIQRASQMGDSELALTLTDFMRKQASEMELARQRKAAAEKSRAPSVAGGVQEAARINAITLELANLDPEDPDDKPTIDALTAERARLQKSVKENMTEAERNATIVANNSGFAPGTPEYKEAFTEAFNRFVAKDRQPTTVEQLESLYTRLGKATENAQNINPDPEAVAKNPEVVLVQKLIKQLEKTDKPNISAAAQLVIDRGFEYGTPAFYKALDEELERQKPPSPAPERVRINAEVRKLKDEQKKLKPDSEEYKAIQEDIDYLENRREGKQPNVSAAVDEIALADFNKAYIDLTPEQRAKVLNKQKEEAKKDREISYGVKREALSSEMFNGKRYKDLTSAEQAKVNKRIETEAKKDREISYGAKREALSAEMFDGKRYKDLTSAEQAKVNKRIETEENVTAATGAAKLVMPGEKGGLKSITDFRNDVFSTIKPFRDTVNASDAALQNINDAINTNNFVSFNASRVQLARALGDSTLSRRDIEQAGGDPSLIGGFFDATSTLFTGTPSIDTQKKIKATLLAIRKVARKKAQEELDTSRDLGIRAGYKEQDLDRAFRVPEITGTNVPTNAAPKPKTVPFNALPN